MQLSPEQLLIVGLIASVVTQVLKLASAKLGFNPGRVVVNVALFVISLVLAYIWGAPALPPISDPAALAVTILEAAAAVAGSASVIYNVLLENIVYPAVKLA